VPSGARIVEGGIGIVVLAGGLVLGVLGTHWIVAFWLVTIGAATIGDAATAGLRQQPPRVRPFTALTRWARRDRHRPD
jgi:hypothetical protein